jgi:YfiH family protein
VIIINKPGVYNNADGLITTIPNILLCLQVADCVPIYLYAFKSKIIGLVHAGWRGIVGGIVQNSIEKMLLLGAYPKEIKIYLGPSIGKCCYEVNFDVANYFNIKNKLKNGKWKVGIREQINFFLLELGIIQKNIKMSSICTFESKSYHSYRRDGVKSGRLISFAGIKR